MNTVRTIAKNTSLLALSNIISAVLVFFLMVYIARYLGEIEFGKYSFAISFTGLFAILVDLGMYNYTIREIARNKELVNKFLSNVLFIKIILSILTFSSICKINVFPSSVKPVIFP